MTLVLYPGNMEIEFLIRILMACFCGLIIGIERSRKHKAAGIRTYIIVTVCAAIITIVSKYGFLDVATESTRVDVSRVAHTIVTGVSFLGAGMIFSRGDKIQGITTAAGIWVMAAIGIACGTGLYIPAVVTTALVLGTQAVMRKVAPFGHESEGRIVVYLDDKVESLRKFKEYLRENGVKIIGTHIKHQEGNVMTYTFKVRISEKTDVVKLTSVIASRKEVKLVDLV